MPISYIQIPTAGVWGYTATLDAQVDSATHQPVNSDVMNSPSDIGLTTFNFRPTDATGTWQMNTAGTVYVMKVKLPTTASSFTITNIHMVLTTAGATLTANQCLASLYSSSKALLSSTANMATVWAGSTGLLTMPLSVAQTVTPTSASTSFVYVALHYNGTTAPTWAAASGNGGVNGLLSAANSLFASADTGRTTSEPATLGTFTAVNTSPWVGLS